MEYVVTEESNYGGKHTMQYMYALLLNYWIS